MAIVFWFCLAAILYHVVAYPAAILIFAFFLRRVRVSNANNSRVNGFPPVTMIVPVYNEARYIEAKIENIARLSYPPGKLKAIIALDGCTDDTAMLAQAAIAASADGDRFLLKNFPHNRGKIAVLNDEIANVSTEWVALTDTSAMIPQHGLSLLAIHFEDPAIGVVCPSYTMAAGGEGGENSYWSYQTSIKHAEGTIAAPIGPHGAFYVFRRALWQPLDLQTINDDFVMPMRMVLNGARAIYDTRVVAAEIEPGTHKHDFRRRVRLGAGNLQQVVLLAGLAHPRRGALAFLFLSGKALRAFLPFLFGALVLASLGAALAGSVIFSWIVLVELTTFGIALIAAVVGPERLPRPLATISYVIWGVVATGFGAALFAFGAGQRVWSTSTAAKTQSAGKRARDKALDSPPK